MTQNYMLVEIAGTMAAATVFSLIFLLAGFVLGWASNVFGFRAPRSRGKGADQHHAPRRKVALANLWNL